MTMNQPTVGPGNIKSVKALRRRGWIQIVLAIGILAWPAIAAISAFMYPSPSGNALIEVLALIGLPLLGLFLLLVGLGIENLFRARKLSRQ